MSKLATFFNGNDTEVGVFYPRHCLVATFPDGEAQKAYLQLRSHGHSDKDVIAVSGPEVVEFAEEYAQKHGLVTKVMTEVSRFFDTEAPYADHDLKMARQGAGFVVAHCRDRWRTAIGRRELDAAHQYHRDGRLHPRRWPCTAARVHGAQALRHGGVLRDDGRSHQKRAWIPLIGQGVDGARRHREPGRRETTVARHEPDRQTHNDGR